MGAGRSATSLLAAAAALSCATAPEAVPEDALARLEDVRDPASATLIAALVDGAPARRARAALAMGRIQSSTYAEPLAGATRDPDHGLRLAALFALGQLGLATGGSPPPAARATCLAALGDPDARLVAAALDALGKLAGAEVAEVAEAVVPYLEHADAGVRAAAAHALFRCRFAPLWRGETEEPPALAPTAVAALARALDDADVEVRRLAAHACSRYGEPAAAAALARATGDPDELVRLFAVRGVGRSGAAAHAAAVEARLADPSAGVRTEAVAALGALGGADRLPATLVEDPSFHVRAALAGALGAGESAGALAMLRSLVADPSPTVRGAALGALAQRLGGGYAVELARALDEGDWRIRAAVAGAAHEIGAAGIELVERALGDADRRVRTAALTALGEIEGGAERALQALADPDLAVRGTAVGLLEPADALPERKLGPLTAAYEDSPGAEWVEVRETIVKAIAPLAAAESLLRRIAERDDSFAVRARARAVLEERAIRLPDETRPAAELSPLVGRTFDADPIVVLETSRGEIRIRCLPEAAPIHVSRFVDLVRLGHYDGLIWHRVVSNFVIQGGDPRGDGWGGAGLTLRDEIHGERFERGTVGMPKAGKDTGGGQLFITHLPTPHLDGNYTVFGRVVGGMDVVDRIEVGDAIVRARLE